ncbi:MAG: hypothetical protein J6Y33_03715 [Prevotella sp.]|nr:hypothetical protein [Prevotella sp.]
MKKVFFWFIVALVLVLPMYLLDKLPKGALDPAIIYVISVVWGTMIGAYTWNTIKKEKKK